MDKVSKQIKTYIEGSKRGTIFFHSDFSRFGDSETTRKAVNRLCNEGIIRRCARGIYIYPKYDEVFNLGEVPASETDIAKAYANNKGINLFATESVAQNLLGLSEQNQMQAVYLTDGATHTIKTNSGNEIRFIHTSDSNLSKYSSKDMRLINIALSGYQKHEVDEEARNKIKQILFGISKEKISNDIKFMKTWKRNLILSLQKELS